MDNKISYQTYDGNLMAKAIGKNMPISLKNTVEILNAIRNKKVEYVLNYLDKVIAMEIPIPFTIYNRETAHKPGMMAGRYSVKASFNIKRLVNACKKNAVDKGFGEDLVIIHASAHKGTTVYKYGRHHGKKAKSTHVEIVVKEAISKENKDAKKNQENHQIRR